MTSTSHQREVLAALKSASFKSEDIPVLGDAGAVVGYLAPITSADVDDYELLEALCRWRSLAKYGFLTVFEPSVEKTRSYLTGFSLPDPGRILFLVRDSDGRSVGNIGLCNVNTDAAELDNVVRGETVPVSGFMRLVIAAVLNFAFDKLNVGRVYLNVLSNNDAAFQSYIRAGFSKIGTQALERTETSDGFRLSPSEQLVPDAGLPGLILMEMQRPAGPASLSALP